MLVKDNSNNNNNPEETNNKIQLANQQPKRNPVDILNVTPFKITNFQILLINDSNNIFVPVLDFNLSSLHLTLNQ